VLGRGRRADGAHGLDLRQLPRGQQRRRATQAVPDQQARLALRGAHPVHRGDQVLDIGRDAGLAEFTFAVAQTREVEAQRRDASRRQSPADLGRGQRVLATGEAMCKDGKGTRRRWSGNSMTPASRLPRVPANSTLLLLMKLASTWGCCSPWPRPQLPTLFRDKALMQ
jgi:hypothetical protein